MIFGVTLLTSVREIKCCAEFESCRPDQHCEPKKYRCAKPRNLGGFGVLLCDSSKKIQKISFPQNDLWGGLELNIWAFGGRICDLFRRVCPFFDFFLTLLQDLLTKVDTSCYDV